MEIEYLLAIALIGMTFLILKTSLLGESESPMSSVYDRPLEESADKSTANCGTSYQSLFGCMMFGSCICTILFLVLLWYILFRLDLGFWDAVFQISTLFGAAISNNA
jgi:hypothetical protein